MTGIARLKQYGKRLKASFFTFFDILKTEKLKIEDSCQIAAIKEFEGVIDFKTDPIRN